MIPAPQSAPGNPYRAFTQDLNRVTAVAGLPEIRVPEKTVRCVWNEQLFNAKTLQTSNGEKLEILFPGYWNFGPGPDFKSAAIKVENAIHEGDVEIHIYSGDWDALQHAHDPDYDRVILHVFLWQSPNRQLLDDGAASPRFELELKGHLTRGILELKDELDFENYPPDHQSQYGRCHEPFSRLTPERVAQLLDAAGDARIQTKMDRFHDRILMHGYEQTFYEAVAEALGYPNNKEPFRRLAESAPLDALHALPLDDTSGRVLPVQAVLFGMAGMIEFRSLDTESLPETDRNYFSTLKRLWASHRARLPASPLEFGMWKFGGIRPANSPYRRIAGLAHLIERHRQEGLFAAMLREFKSAFSIFAARGYNGSIPGKLTDFFCVEADDYWADHLAPGGKKLAKGQQLIGPARSAEITVNMALPIGLIYARAAKSLELETGFNLLFQSRKATGDNRLLRFMKHYVFGNDKDKIKALKSDKQMQGLMQIYQDFCTQNQNSCQHCRFPELLQRDYS